MKPGARMAAARDVLHEIFDRHRPAAMALSDWGKSHRFAGGGDRSAIGNIVYDALRKRRSIAARFATDTPRALALGAAGSALALTPDAVIAAAADPSPHAIGALSQDEQSALANSQDHNSDPSIAGDFPPEFQASLERAFGASLVDELAAMAERAPVGLRANMLKADAPRVIKALERHGPIASSLAPNGVIIPVPDGPKRTPNVEVDPAHGKGWFEVQDVGSQIAAALTGAGPRAQVLDLCAGAGGKSLALAAMMQNTGQIYAYDRNGQQLRPIFERLKRAGARNVQTLPPGDEAGLEALGPRFDVVLADAPCTGSGTWRRRPDAKWRLSQRNLETRIEEQRAVLTLARNLVAPGGALVYVTCSIFPEENQDQTNWFQQQAGEEFQVVAYKDNWSATMTTPAPETAQNDDDGPNDENHKNAQDTKNDGILLTPYSHGTDGFYISVFRRNAA